MGLDSLLASLKSGVAEVTEVQASRNRAFACNPTRFERVAEDTGFAAEIYTATHETSAVKAEVTAQSTPMLACTHETSVTPKTIKCEVASSNTAAASRWWLIHYPDRDPLEVACFPEETHAIILERHPDAIAAESFTPIIRPPSAPLAFENETLIRDWLAKIDETDKSTINEVIRQCQVDTNARSYFIQLAGADKLQKQLSDTAFADDRRTCYQCLNLIGRRCRAAQRREINVSPNYEPIRDMPQRCEGYLPNTDDQDSRSGRERWPDLLRQGVK